MLVFSLSPQSVVIFKLNGYATSNTMKNGSAGMIEVNEVTFIVSDTVSSLVWIQ